MGVSDSDFDDRIRLTRPSPQAGASGIMYGCPREP